MKKLLLTVPLVAVLISGCKTSTTNPDQKVLDPLAGAAIRVTLAASVPLVTARDDNAAPYFQAVAAAFEAAANTGTYDPVMIKGTLDTISVRELHSAMAEQIVLTAFAAYRAVLAEAVNAKMDQAKYGPVVKGILSNAAAGIKDGLGMVVQIVEPEPAPTPSPL